MTEKPSGFDLRSRLDIALAAVLFSTGGAAIKLSTLSGWQVAGARSLIAALVLSLLAPRALTGWSWRILVVAGFHASTLTVFTLATKLTTAANAIFLQSTAPLYVVGLAPLMLKERFRGSDVAVAGAFLIGLVTIVGAEAVPQASAPDPALGNFLGAMSGVCWAGTLLGLRWLGRSNAQNTNPGTTAVIAGNALTFLVALPFMFHGGAGADANALDLATIVYLGGFQVAAPYLLLTRGLRRVPAFSASLIILLELALNPVWTWIAHGERLSGLSLVGGMMIVMASVAKARSDRRGVNP